ncbi:MAG: hypothetical protein ACYC1D_11615 [Acidimicrobiales bacterium]
MSVLRSGARAGRGFGALSAARSVGTVVGDLVRGLLYSVGASLAYGYAALVAAIAGVIVLGALPAPEGLAARAGTRPVASRRIGSS